MSCISILDPQILNNLGKATWQVNQASTIVFFEDFRSTVYLVDSQNDQNKQLLDRIAKSKLFAMFLDIRLERGAHLCGHIVVTTENETIAFSNFTTLSKGGTPNKVTSDFFKTISQKQCFGKGFSSYKQFLSKNYGYDINVIDIETDSTLSQPYISFCDGLYRLMEYKIIVDHFKNMVKFEPNRSRSVVDLIAISYNAVQLFVFLLKNQDQLSSKTNNLTNVYKCPLCNKFKGTKAHTLSHIIKAHDYMINILKSIAKQRHPANTIICDICNFKTHSYDEFVTHVIENHQKRIIDILMSIDNQPLNEFCSNLKNAYEEHINSEKTKKDKNRNNNNKVNNNNINNNKINNNKAKNDYIDDDDDDDYCNFIASTIKSDGIQNSQKAAISDISPINIVQPKGSSEAEIDSKFWSKLDTLDCNLQARKKITDPTKGEFTCLICKKSCKTYVKLLKHCWENHQNEIDNE